MTPWMQYAVIATKMALDDAGWHPEDRQGQEMTVRIFKCPLVSSRTD